MYRSRIASNIMMSLKNKAIYNVAWICRIKHDSYNHISMMIHDRMTAHCKALMFRRVALLQRCDAHVHVEPLAVTSDTIP